MQFTSPSRPGRVLACMVITGLYHWGLVRVIHSLKQHEKAMRLWALSAWACGRRDTELWELVPSVMAAKGHSMGRVGVKLPSFQLNSGPSCSSSAVCSGLSHLPQGLRMQPWT